MVSKDELSEHTGRRPFAPFWLSLANGETIMVTREASAVVMPKQMVVSTDGLTLRWIPLDQISDHGLLIAGNGHKQNGGPQ